VHFGPKRDEVTVEWRRLRNKKLYDLCCSPDTIWVVISKIRRRVGHVAYIRERDGDKNVVVEKPKAKRPIGRPRQRWENIKINLQKVG
jgi:hypothetical protein